ncbi:MAG TPA: HAD family phosphatase [Bacteroidales bacterium]|nr:HAD family phosphatase [Bacteroidales bacterium]
MIKNIILDLGGVVLNIDYNRTIEAFKDLGIPNALQFYSKQQQAGLFDLLEIGKISARTFRNEIRKLTDVKLTDSAIDKAWNAMLLDFPEQRMNTLIQLKQHYKTFLLSNTNAIHFSAYTKILQKKFNCNNLSDFFHKEFYSHLIHKRKPHPETFLFVLNSQKIKPSETLFIDDSIQHIKGAETVGLHTYHLTEESLETYLIRNQLL